MKLFSSMLMVGLICTMVSSVMAGDVISKLPDSTKIVAKLDLARLRDSQVYAKIENNNLEKFEEAQAKIAEQIGIDPETVSAVWLAGVKKNEGMLVLEGVFDATVIKEAVSLKPELQIVERAGCELAVYCPDKKNSSKNLAVILDKNTLAIGNPAFVDAFIINSQGKGAVLPENKITLAKNALNKNVLFQGILLAAPAVDNNPNNQIWAAIQGGSASLDVTDKITCNANINLDSEQNAKAVTQILYGLLAFYEMKQPQDYKGEIVKESILKNLKIQQNGNDVSITGGIGNTVVEQLLEKVN